MPCSDSADGHLYHVSNYMQHHGLFHIYMYKLIFLTYYFLLRYS